MKKTSIICSFIVASLTSSYAAVSISGSAVNGLVGADVGKTGIVLVDTTGAGFASLVGAAGDVPSSFVNVFTGVVTGGLFGNAFAIDPPAAFDLDNGTTVLNGIDAGESFGILLFDTANDYRVYTNAGWLVPTEGGSLTLTGGTTAAGASPDGVGSTAVPEPSAFAMLSGLLALGWVAIRRRS